MARLLGAPLTLLMLSAMLYASAVPAAACTCGLPIDPEEIRSGLEEWGAQSLIVEGTIAPPDGDSVQNIRINPEVIYWGDPSANIVLLQTWAPPFHQDSIELGKGDAMCGYDVMGREGDRYVLDLWPAPGNPSLYRPGSCASYPVSLLDDPPIGGYPNYYLLHYEALIAATDGGQPPAPLEPTPEPDSPDDGAVVIIEDLIYPAPLAGGAPAQQQTTEDETTKDTPWLVVLPLAFAIPLAVLLVPSFLRKRTAGGH